MRELFKETFESEPELISQSPGRLEILGNHTDYNEGFVLSTAVDSYTSMAFSKSDNSICRIFSPQVEGKIREIDLNDLEHPLPGKDWLNYIRGVLLELQKLKFNLSPFNALIQSEIPLSAGMSSSAAIEMALVNGLSKLFKFDLTIEQKARVGQGCENNYIGANTGLMDQFTSLSGKKNHLVLSEYRNLSLDTVFFPENLSILVFNSGVKHDLSSEYNERREQCENAVRILQSFYPDIKALRDVPLKTLLQHKNDFPEKTYKRALHVIGENERVLQAIKHLSNKNTEQFGQLLFESHKSSIENFENSCQELDFLIELAESSQICLGARLSGGGFGGISIHLVDNSNVQKYRDLINLKFSEKYARIPDSYLCKCSDGGKVF